MVERILLDANSLGHASHQGTVLRSGDQETQAVYGVVQSARMYRTRHPSASFLWLWDGDSWRKAESDTYKRNRTDTPDKIEARRRYKEQAPYIRRALRHLGMPQLSAANYEADDLAAIMSRKFVAAGDSVKLISGDRDWIQLVGPDVTWEDHRDASRFVTAANFSTVTGYKTVKQFVQSKALQGDVSDNLSGVGQIGEVKAQLMLQTWGSVQNFMADADRAATFKRVHGKNLPKAFQDFASMPERQQRFAHNMRLMSLAGDFPPVKDLRLDKGAFNSDEFLKLCHELGFASIFRPAFYENWVAPFNR